MEVHEYQAKEILGRFGAPVPRGGLAYSPEQVAYRARELGGAALGRQGAGPRRAGGLRGASSCAGRSTRYRPLRRVCSGGNW